jgi:hypothetical protein
MADADAWAPLRLRHNERTVRIDNSFLLGLYGGASPGFSTVDLAAAARRRASADPTPPWGINASAPKRPELLKAVMSGRPFIDEAGAKLDVKGPANEDYRKLFATYQGLSSLQAIVERAGAKGVSAAEMKQLERKWAAGLDEVADYVDALKLDTMRLVRGDVASNLKSGVGLARPAANLSGTPIHEGSYDDAVTAFSGPVKFSMTVQRTVTAGGTTTNVGAPKTIDFDLAEMGSQTRSMANVVKYMNDKLAAANLETRMTAERTEGKSREMKVGDKTIKLSDGPDRWALKLAGFSGETVKFDAPDKADAVYVVQGVGDDELIEGSEATQLLKFQTDVNNGTAPPDPTQRFDEANWVSGRTFQTTLSSAISSARATATGPDGAIYVLADIGEKLGEQTIKGESDVALLKYDSSGKLLFSRTLGAASDANGYALAVSADGKVAIAGSVKGGLADASTIASDRLDVGDNAQKTDSFVSVFNAEGEELWTQRRGARDDDEALGVAFGGDGSVYVTGRARSAVPGGTGLGGWDGYVQGFSPPTTLKPNGEPKFGVQFGGVGDDKASSIVVDGSSMYVAGVEAGQAVVRRYTLNASGAPTLAATRNLGPLGTGSVAGLAVQNGRVVLAGTTNRTTLGDGAATVTKGPSGGQDAFVMTLNADLSAGADTLNFYGGSGDDQVSAVKVMNDGSVYLTGKAGSDLPGTAKLGEQDGFAIRLDAATGAVEWSKRFTGAAGKAAPTAIAVAEGGASVLDRLGLPAGVIDQTPSKSVIAGSSLRAGDRFYVKSSPTSRPTAVTIAADDTLESLAKKIEKASGYRAKVTIAKDIVREAKEGEDESAAIYGALERLKIEPKDPRATVELIAGEPGRDALQALGLNEGLVRQKPAKEEKGYAGVFGLKLPRDLQIGDKEQNKASMEAVNKALDTIRDAYKALAALNDPKTAKTNNSGGKAPAYIQSQLANYQAALTRLSGG